MRSHALKGATVSDGSSSIRVYSGHQLDRSFHSDFSVLDKNGSVSLIQMREGGVTEILNASGGTEGTLFGKEASEKDDRSNLISLTRKSVSESPEKLIEAHFSRVAAVGSWRAQILNSWEATVLAARAQMIKSHASRKHRLATQVNESLNLFVTSHELDRQISKSPCPQNLLMEIQNHGIDTKAVRNRFDLVEALRIWNRKAMTQPGVFAIPDRDHGHFYEPKVSIPIGNYLPVDEILAPAEIARFPLSESHLQKWIDEKTLGLFSLEVDPSGEISVVRHEICLLAGAFLQVCDPYSQNIYLDEVQAKGLVKILKAAGVPVCSLEGPFGLYRTGGFCQSNISDDGVDLYCFGHEISNGTSSSGALVVRESSFDEEATRFYPGLFDQQASCIQSVFKQFDNPGFSQGLKAKADMISARMSELGNQFSEIIESSWTRGHTGVISISSRVSSRGTEFSYLHNHGLLPFVIRAHLLRDKKVLVSCVPKTNSILFSLPLTTTEKQIDELYDALYGALELLNSGDIVTLYSPAFPGHKVTPTRRVRQFQQSISPDTKTVFFAHLADPRAVQLIHSSLRRMPADVAIKKYSEWAPKISWERALTAYVKGANGRVTELNVLGFTDTSSSIMNDIRSGNRRTLVSKIQSGIEYAAHIGASAVGLGQFTSIVTNNGLMLDPCGISLTTGNSFTTLLMVRSSLRAAEKKGLNLAKSRAAMIGAAGNIVSTAALLLADSVAECWLIYHTLPESSSKLRRMLHSFLVEIKHSQSQGPFVTRIKDCLKQMPVTDDASLLHFLNSPPVRECFQIHSTLEKVCEADIVLTGTNSPKPFLGSDHFKQGAVVVDVGVPFNVDSAIVKERPDIELVRGGMALLPSIDGHQQIIPLPYFPPGESFACMAETMILSLTGVKRLNVGLLTKSRVLETGILADQTGFALGSDKHV